VTAVAIRGDGLLRFPVTVEARVVVCWCAFEYLCDSAMHVIDDLNRAMTDAAVVVVLLLHRCVGQIDARFARAQESRDHVLMFVVRKLDLELQRRRQVAKRVTGFVTRRSF